MSLDQHSNPLSYEHSGTIKYTDDIEPITYTYVRDVFQHAQKVNGITASIIEFANTFN